MEQWKQYKIEDICEQIFAGGDAAKYNTSKHQTPVHNIPIYANSTENEGLYGYCDKAAVSVPAVTIAARGAGVGFVAFREKPFVPIVRLITLITNKLADTKFIYYYLKNRRLSGDGSAIPQITVPMVKKENILLPDLVIQQQIASILSSLDSKIELNRRINDNLEQQAQALFNYYFIDNRNKLGDYTESNLTQIATYLNGLAMQKYRPSYGEIGIPVLKIKELGQGFCDISSDLCSPSIRSEYIVNDGDIIFSWSGTLMIDTWCGGTCGLNQHLFKVNSELYPQWFIYFWTNHHLDKFIRVAKDKAVTMGHIKRSELVSSEVIIPNKTTLENLDKIFKPIFEESTSKKIENRKLEEVRNTLLSKLMSGELKINDLHS